MDEKKDKYIDFNYPSYINDTLKEELDRYIKERFEERYIYGDWYVEKINLLFKVIHHPEAEYIWKKFSSDRKMSEKNHRYLEMNNDQEWLAKTIAAAYPSIKYSEEWEKKRLWHLQAKQQLKSLIQLFEDAPSWYGRTKDDLQGLFYRNVIDFSNIEKPIIDREKFDEEEYFSINKESLSELDDSLPQIYRFIKLTHAQSIMDNLKLLIELIDDKKLYWSNTRFSGQQARKLYFTRAIQHEFILRTGKKNRKYVKDIVNIIFDSNTDEKQIRSCTKDIVENPESFPGCTHPMSLAPIDIWDRFSLTGELEGIYF